MVNDSQWTGVRVAVTGGTSGLGKALVTSLTKAGARVAFVARSEDDVVRVAAETGSRFGWRRRQQRRDISLGAANHRQPGWPRRADKQRLQPRTRPPLPCSPIRTAKTSKRHWRSI